MRGGTRGAGALLVSPLFLTSVGALLVNDHVLKRVWPGWVTGKLSDVAGVVMVAIATTAALRRAGVAFAATALAFTALKTVPIVAVRAAPVLGGVTRTDPSDLLALAVLVPLWVWVGAPADRPALGPIGGRGLLPAQFFAIGCAVFATTATSCASEGVLGVVVIDGVVFAETSGGVWRSDDGGRTFTETDLQPWDDRFGEVPFAERRSCVGDRCYEVLGAGQDGAGAGVDVVPADGAREPVVRFTPGDLDRLTELDPPRCGTPYVSDVAAVELADGVHLVVAMGEPGVLHLAPDGTREWVAVGEFGFPPDVSAGSPLGIAAASSAPVEGFATRLWVGRAILLAVPLLPLPAIPLVRRLARRNGRDPGAASASLGALALVTLLPVLFLLWVLDDPRDSPFVLVAFAVLLAAAVVPALAFVSVWSARPRRRRSRKQLPPPEAPDIVG